MAELSPCPFCGHKAKISPPKTSGGIVRAGTIACTNLAGCFTPHVVFDVEGDRQEQQAVALWNARAGQ